MDSYRLSLMVFHVEMLGLPGSGKSTVRNDLCMISPHGIISAEEAYKIAFCRLIYPNYSWSVCRHVPQTVFNKLLSLQIRLSATPANERYGDFYSVATDAITTYSDDDSRQVTVQTWLEILIEKYDAISRTFSPQKTVIFDEGFLQRSLSLFCPPYPATPLKKKYIKQYLSSMPTPDLIVILDVSAEVSHERMSSREIGAPSSYTHLTQVELQQSLDRMRAYINYVAEMSEDSNIPLFRINNEGQIKNTVQQIHQVLLQTER